MNSTLIGRMCINYEVTEEGDGTVWRHEEG